MVIMVVNILVFIAGALFGLVSLAIFNNMKK